MNNETFEKNDNFDTKSKSSLKNKSLNPIASFFGFSDLKTTFKKEIIGGISTFLAMAYILNVEPAILSGANSVVDGGTSMDKSGIFLATAIIAALSTLVQGLWARVPISLAPSMGLNAMFVFNVAGKDLGYEGAMICVMLSSIIFTIIAITPIRAKVVNALPHSLQVIIGVGIGFFIAYVGLGQMGLFRTENNLSNGLPIADVNTLKIVYPGLILGLVVLIGAIILFKRGFSASVAVMMLGGLIIAMIFGNLIKDDAFQKSFGTTNFHNFNWNYMEMFNGFASNIKGAYNQFANSKIWSNPTLYISIFVLCLLNFFDATATITTVGNQISKINNKEIIMPKSALIVDAASSIVGGAIGTSHISCYVESTVGVSQGAKSGFANIITGGLFLLAIPLFPIFQMIPNCVSGAATAFIGTVMILSITEIEWLKPEISLAGFFGILLMITTYNIAVGVAFEVIFYTVGLIATKKIKEVSIIIWCLDAIFILYFIALAFIQ